MTARYEIRQLLSNTDKPITHVEIIKHVVGKDYNVSSIKSALAKMECIGEVINSGEFRKPLYTLNAEFIPAEEIREEKLKTYTRTPDMKGPRIAKDILSLCKKHSRIYKLIDIPLRGVRP